MRGRTEPETLSWAGRVLNLPMYELPEMAAALTPLLSRRRTLNRMFSSRRSAAIRC